MFLLLPVAETGPLRVRRGMPRIAFPFAVETSEAETKFLSVLVIYRCQANHPKIGLKEVTIILFTNARVDQAQLGGSYLGSPVGLQPSSGWARVISQASSL